MLRQDLGTSSHPAADRTIANDAVAWVAPGAEIDALDDEGNPPVAVAALHGALATVTLLVRRGCDVDALSSAAKSPFQLACQHGPPRVDYSAARRTTAGPDCRARVAPAGHAECARALACASPESLPHKCAGRARACEE